METYHAIVLGTGGVGSAALYHLARRGLRVLGIDRFPGGHDRGSSHGHTRIIRQAYFEHPDYVPLLLRAYELWAELEQRTAQRLFYQVGLLQVGPADGAVIPGVLASARQHGLQLDELSDRATEARFPGFRVPPGYGAAFEPLAGFLLVEQCVLAHLAMAARLGAQQRVGESVVAFRSTGQGVVVQTDRQEYHADRLVITAGPWSPQLLASLQVPLEVRRKDVFWYGPAAPQYAMENGCPTFLFELPHGVFYGFPAIDAKGVKAAEHSGGPTVLDPLTVDRSPNEENQVRVANFLSNCLPDLAGGQVQASSTCFYTMTPDEHFLVDRHPEHSNIVLAAGLSGHGFKFTGGLGEILAELAVEERTSSPIKLFAIDRSSLKVG